MDRIGFRLNKLQLLMFVLMTLSGTASASPDEDAAEWLRNPSIGNYKAYAEFKMAHYADAKAIWSVLAEHENGEALFNLAILAEDGLGEPADMKRALTLYERSALAGGRKAQYRLGLLYSAGGVVPRDVERARRFLAMAAEDGDEDARQRLARLDAEGGETPFARAETLSGQARYEEAAAIYRSLSAAGDARARTRLAWMYEAGRGVGRDLSEAARLFRQSAEAGDPEAQYALAVMLETGRGMSMDAVESRSWLERAASAGYPEARQALDDRAREQ